MLRSPLVRYLSIIRNQRLVRNSTHDRGSQRYVKSGSVTTDAPHQGLMQKHRKQSRWRWHHILLPRYLYGCL